MANNNPKLLPVINAIHKYHISVFLPKNIKFKSVPTNSCFTIHKFEDTKVKINKHDFRVPNQKSEKPVSVMELDLFFKDREKQIIDKWLIACIKAENVTIDFFKYLMKDRMNAIHRIKDLEILKGKILKEISESKNFQFKINVLNNKITNINQKINIQKNKYLNAVKQENIWWLDKFIDNLDKNIVPDNSTKDERNTLKYWRNVDIDNLNKLDKLREYKDLKQKLLNKNYFFEVNKDVKLIEEKINDLNDLKKFKKSKKTDSINNQFLKAINCKIDNLTKQKNKLIYEHIPTIDNIIVRNLLYDKLNDILNESGLPKDNNTKIRKHILDESVKQVCTSIKSNIANYEKGNIKSFRVRRRKLNKISKNLFLEKEFFKEGSIFKTVFDTIKCEKNREEFNIFDVIKSKTTCNLVYNSDTETYKLYVPQSIKPKTTDKKKVISTDLGKRTFASCLTNNEVIEIGRESEMDIVEMVKKLNELKDPKIKMRNKKQKMKRLRRLLKNKVDELHWKTINFMTGNYGTVIIGDIKVQEIVKREGCIKGITKDVIHALKFYKFKKRLEYKCKLKGVSFIKVDEYGSTKICSKCGAYNDIGGSKTYKCEKCGLCIDRDINPTRTFIMLAKK